MATAVARVAVLQPIHQQSLIFIYIYTYNLITAYYIKHVITISQLHSSIKLNILPSFGVFLPVIREVGNGTMCQMVCASVGEDIQAHYGTVRFALETVDADRYSKGFGTF
jgi:hypothetical protein